MTNERKLAAVKRLLAEAKAEGNTVLVKFYTEKLEELETPQVTTFIMSVRNKETNEIKVVNYEAMNSKQAKKDWRDNDYTVRFMATTQEEFDIECEKFYAKVERQVSMRAIMKEIRG